MSMREHSIYYQGVLIEPECFDPSRLLLFILEDQNISIGEAERDSLENGDLTPELHAALADAFMLDESYSSLEEIIVDVLTYCPDVYDNIQVELNKAGGVAFHRLTDFTGEFYYSRVPESVTLEEANVLAFPTPLAWEPAAERRPGSLDEAISWLERAGQSFFQTDFDWEPKLGELLGSIYG